MTEKPIPYKPMITTTDKYINLFTDFGFKKIFGEEPNKDLLIAFLNELLVGKERIKDLTYLKNERLPKHQAERKAVFDLFCENAEGEKFIVEVQRVKQEFFKDRSIYYSSFAIQEQARKGKEWKYELKSVYTIAILDFTFDEAKTEKILHRVKLVDVETQEVFYHKLTYIYLEIPKFNKELDELENDYERWLFAFKSLHQLRDKPEALQVGIFKRLMELAEIARFNKKEQNAYQESLKDYWDLKGALDTAFAEGKEERNNEVALNGLRSGVPLEFISQMTGLSLAEIELLKKHL